jgi:hypothetical protein
MARSHLRHVVQDRAGNVVQNALVYVYLRGTTTAVADMYAGSSGDAAYYPSDASSLLSFTDFTETVEVAEPPPLAPGDDLAAALLEGGTIRLAPGTFDVTTMLNASVAGTTLVGEGWSGTTILRATAAIAAVLRVSAESCALHNIEINANDLATYGLDLYNAARISTDRVYVHDAVSHGVNIACGAGAPTRNNNGARFKELKSNSNGGHGISVSTFETDNNCPEFLICESQGNTGAGLLYKGQGLRVYGGQYQFNGTYGIVLGESGDASFTTGGFILFPWLEGNTTNGLRNSTKATRNTLMVDIGQQDVVDDSATEACMVLQADSGGVFQIGAFGRYLNVVPDPSTGLVTLAPAGSDTNMDLLVQGKGSGVPKTSASTTTRASLRVPHGTAPTSPVNGDLWTTTAGLYVRINGATVGPLS